MINVYDYGAGVCQELRYHATVAVPVTEHWKEEYESYGPTEEAAVAGVRKQVKKLKRALKRVNLEAHPCVDIS